MGDLLKEAIADAKAVRETALQNAKMALEEAFTPQLKSMLSAKLKEDEFEDEEDEFGGEEDEFGGEEVPEEEPEETYHEDDVDINVGDDEEEFGGEEEFGDEEAEEEPEMEGVIEINGVKYAPVVQEDEFEDEEDETDNLDLEAIIRELESELSEGEEEDEDEEPVEESDNPYDGNEQHQDYKNAPKSSKHGGGNIGEGNDKGINEDDTRKDPKSGSGPSDPNKSGHEMNEDEEYDIDESLFEQEDGDDDKDKKDDEIEEQSTSSGVGSGTGVKKASSSDEEDPGKGAQFTRQKFESIRRENREYKEAVSFLKDKLHEVNILNAKLLFTNKLFKEFALDNNQKLRVVETFDRAQSTREIKLVYSTLAEQFGDNGSIKKKSITESASSKTGSTKPKKKIITEEDEVADRFKKLAGIL